MAIHELTAMNAGALCLLVALSAICFWFVYSPQHWLRRVDFGKVNVDGRQVQAESYFGNPAFSEAEAVALAHVSGVGDCFLDFGSAKVRVGNRSDSMRIPGGVWCYRSMFEGNYVEPLLSQRLNEFRIAAPNGQVISVQF